MEDLIKWGNLTTSTKNGLESLLGWSWKVEWDLGEIMFFVKVSYEQQTVLLWNDLGEILTWPLCTFGIIKQTMFLLGNNCQLLNLINYGGLQNFIKPLEAALSIEAHLKCEETKMYVFSDATFIKFCGNVLCKCRQRKFIYSVIKV